MVIDRFLEFSDKQTVTASAASTNSSDTGLAARNIGVGFQPLYLVIMCMADMTDAGSDSTVTASLQTASENTFAAPVTILTDNVFAALSKAGTTHIVQLPPSDSYLEFLRVYYTVANGNLTTGKFSAFITDNVDIQRSYASGFTVL